LVPGGAETGRALKFPAFDPIMGQMAANFMINSIGLGTEDEALASALRTQIPAVPSPGSEAVWQDSVNGAGGVLRIRDPAGRHDLDRDLRVILLDGRTVAFWLTPDGRRLGWLRAASA